MRFLGSLRANRRRRRKAAQSKAKPSCDVSKGAVEPKSESSPSEPKEKETVESLRHQVAAKETMSDEKKEEKLSAVEGFKQESNHLLGPIPEELVDENDFFGKASTSRCAKHRRKRRAWSAACR